MYLLIIPIYFIVFYVSTFLEMPRQRNYLQRVHFLASTLPAVLLFILAYIRYYIFVCTPNNVCILAYVMLMLVFRE